MIDGNQLREEFGRYLAEHKATRWGMDAALMHVCKIAYDAGKADGPATPERKVGMHPALGAPYGPQAAAEMTDYMKEAERLSRVLEDIAQTALRGVDNEQIRGHLMDASALLAHIQRGAVLEGWKEATIAWEVCASIHREYAKKKDPFFTTRQADFVKHTEAARAALLAAAPDQFRDAAKMMAEPADPDPLHLSRILHELAGAASLCWEPRPTGVFDPQLAIQFVEQALAEIRSRMTSASAEVPMPQSYAERPIDYTGGVWIESQMRTYGAACRAAGEAAGYAHAIKVIKRLRDSHQTATGECQSDCDFVTAWDSAIDALRGEVKP